MDMTTLAMAKAYTDEKVGSGGSGGVSLPFVELEAEFDFEGLPFQLSDTDKATMQAINTPTAIIAFHNTDGFTYNWVFNRKRDSAGKAYSAYVWEETAGMGCGITIYVEQGVVFLTQY